MVGWNASTAGGSISIPGQETKIPYATQPKRIKKKKKNEGNPEVAFWGRFILYVRSATQPCPALCNSMDCSLPGSFVLKVSLFKFDRQASLWPTEDSVLLHIRAPPSRYPSVIICELISSCLWATWGTDHELFAASGKLSGDNGKEGKIWSVKNCLIFSDPFFLKTLLTWAFLNCH